jgi:hypothetical protein
VGWTGNRLLDTEQRGVHNRQNFRSHTRIGFHQSGDLLEAYVVPVKEPEQSDYDRPKGRQFGQFSEFRRLDVSGLENLRSSNGFVPAPFAFARGSSHNRQPH